MILPIFPGDHSEEETPVPIPNTEVKGLSGDGTVGFAYGRVARCRVYFLGGSDFDRNLLFFVDFALWLAIMTLCLLL